MKIDVEQLIGPFGISVQNGRIVYDKIFPELSAGHCVELDFSKITHFATPFFHTAIGQLYKDFSAEKLGQLLTISNISPPYAAGLIKTITADAKRYYTDPVFRVARDKVLREMSEGE